MPNHGGYARLSADAEARFEALCAIRGRLRRTHRQALDGTAHALRAGSMDPAIPARHLLYLDLSAREPLAAIVVGDLDTATHVTWQLSGTGIRARNALWGSVREAGQLYLEQRKVGIEAPAVVAWLGYRSPNMASALLNGSAHRGVEILERDLEIFAALRHGEPHLALEAHSYAATLAAQALDSRAGSTALVQALATIGSAGIPRQLSRDPGRLNVPADHIYEAIADRRSSGLVGTAAFGPETHCRPRLQCCRQARSWPAGGERAQHLANDPGEPRCAARIQGPGHHVAAQPCLDHHRPKTVGIGRKRFARKTEIPPVAPRRRRGNFVLD